MLNAKNLGLAGGILWGVSLMVCTWLSLFTGWGISFLVVMESIYPGFDISFVGSILGLIWGFLDGFVGLFLLAWIYNKLNG